MVCYSYETLCLSSDVLVVPCRSLLRVSKVPVEVPIGT